MNHTCLLYLCSDWYLYHCCSGCADPLLYPLPLVDISMLFYSTVQVCYAKAQCDQLVYKHSQNDKGVQYQEHSLTSI